MHKVEIGERMKCMVSEIAIPEVTTPPGELMYIEISFFGFSASRKSSCAITSVDIGPRSDR